MLRPFVAKTYRPLTEALDEGKGKFVVLTRNQEVHLVLSPMDLTPYHADIVHRYLQVDGRGEVEAVGSGSCRILSKAWKVHGGGYYHLQPRDHRLTLSGKSTAFGKYQVRLLSPHASEIPAGLGLAGFALAFA